MTNSRDYTPRLLPESFQPCQDTVIIGRGKAVVNHPGNQRLQLLLKQDLSQYHAASTRDLKTEIIVKVAKQVPIFVKVDKVTGRWMALSEAAGRAAVGQAFRDLLQGRYRSSKQSKQVKRALEKCKSLVNAGCTDLGTALPPVLALTNPLTRVVSVETVTAAMRGNSSCAAAFEDTTWVDRLLVLSTSGVAAQAGNPFEPTPIREGPTNAASASASPLQQYLGAKSQQPFANRSFLEILKQQQSSLSPHLQLPVQDMVAL